MHPNAQAAPIPEHVPAHLVQPYPLVLGATTMDDPFKTMIPALHEGPPVIYATNAYPGGRPAWVFRRAADLSTIYQDTEHFSNKDFAPFAKMIGDTWSQVPAETDPPMHQHYRAIINPLFVPRKLAALEDRVRQFARDYAQQMKAKGENGQGCEFMADFAFRFPIVVFLELMGLPVEQVDQFLAWEKSLLHEPDFAKIADAVRAVKGYLLEQLEDRRKKPRDDFISYALTAEVEGRKLNEDELIGFVFGLFIGGMDTVSTNMGLHFRHLAENPAQQAALRADPSLIPAAVEELLRAYAAVTTFRTCVKPVVVGGVQLMPGDKVAMCTTLACRDPEAFPAPNEVRFDRNPRHLTFGFGPHRCAGAPLARREMIIALEEVLAALPPFRLKEGAPIMTFLGGMIQPHALQLVW